jgi:hypothetical protein
MTSKGTLGGPDTALPPGRYVLVLYGPLTTSKRCLWVDASLRTRMTLFPSRFSGVFCATSTTFFLGGGFVTIGTSLAFRGLRFAFYYTTYIASLQRSAIDDDGGGCED